MPGAGELRERITFEQKGLDSDGERLGDWNSDDDAVTRAAKLLPLRGGEQVVASRLAGRQPYIITVRRDTATRAITTDWRAYDARNTSRRFAILSIAPHVDPASKLPSNAWLDILAEEGGADG